MKAYIENFACLNRSDELELITQKFLQKNIQIVSEIDEADLVLIYTCGSTEAFIRRSYEAVLDIHNNHPSKKLIICGCSTVTARNLYNELPGIFCTPTNFSELNKELGIDISIDEIKNARLTIDFKSQRNSAIVVQKGCVRRCTYCSIWLAVGPIISKNMSTIIKQVNKSIDNGQYNVTITGDCIADYGLDIGSNIMELLDNICSVSDKLRLTVYDIHPASFVQYSKEFISLAQRGYFDTLGIPLQSGSRKILHLMNRDFDIKEFEGAIIEIKKMGVKIDTDIIIGFPGETEEDFNETVEILERIGFDNISVNMYTDTPYNASRKMSGKVSKKEIFRRYVKLENKNITGIDRAFFEYQFMKLINSNGNELWRK